MRFDASFTSPYSLSRYIEWAVPAERLPLLRIAQATDHPRLDRVPDALEGAGQVLITRHAPGSHGVDLPKEVSVDQRGDPVENSFDVRRGSRRPR